jgi:hypothetical protein
LLSRARGIVTGIKAVRGSTLELAVEVCDVPCRAIAYTGLTGEVSVGDEVLLNTTACAKNLGTGGYHFVMANLSNPESEQPDQPGHIVKARYTPVQHTVLSVEEDDSPHRHAIQSFTSLGGIPVVTCQLHSQIAPVSAAILRHTHPHACVAYVMTDSASLPIGISRLVSELQCKGLITKTITCGQAFGGDLEAINLYTALIAAKSVLGAEAVIVAPGPGNVGSGTKYGFGSIEQGEIVNSVNILCGEAIAVARISFADPRPRHQGLSHHTVTALSDIALTKCTVVLPMMDQMRLLAVQEQIAHSAIAYKHKVRILDGEPGIAELQSLEVAMSSMGRGYDDDPEFFLSASAAGSLAAERVNQGRTS